VRLPFLSRPKPVFPVARDFPYVELRGADSRVVVVPSLGGKIAELWLGGREWLWHSPVLPLAPGSDGDSYVETADTGGVDECFPTQGACRIPGWVRGFGGVELPDHGELWSQVPEMDVRTSRSGQIARCSWTGYRLPYRLDRAVRIDQDGVVHVSYAVINDGREKMPFVWSMHPVFPLGEHTRVRLPAGARLRVFAQHGIDLGEPRSEHQWPFIRGGGKVHDFSVPHAIARKFACKLFVDVPEGEAGLVEGDLELRFQWDPTQIPHVGLWVNKRGWTPFRDGEPYMNLALQPAIGAPDTLVDALGDWKSVAWLDPGETRRWAFRWSAHPAEHAHDPDLRP
jgi:galactose mutarotase-like enzyme